MMQMINRHDRTRAFVEHQDATDMQVSLFEMLDSLSTALDLINPALHDHHKTTCYIACCLAEQLNYDTDAFNDVFAASIVHDIGAIALADRLKLLDFEQRNPHMHGEFGAVLLSKFELFSKFAPIVRFHHVPWDFGKGHVFNETPVPDASHLIHLADRVAVLIKPKEPIFAQVAPLRERISDLSGRYFMPEMVDAFLEESRKEVFWLDLTSRRLDQVLARKSKFADISLNLDELVQLSRFYALIIDARSRFTATHSSGVAASAEAIAEYYGLPEDECKKCRVAGYLHDIGKLSIPNEILEKNGELDLMEWRTVRAHTYYTWQVLAAVDGLQEIALWAADHHEHLSGDGYPFRRKGDDLPLGSRILAVADVFTALAEDRPYRLGMKKGQLTGILLEMVDENKLDAEIVNLLIENFEPLQTRREAAQNSEKHALAEFWQVARGSMEPHASEQATNAT